MAWAISLTDSYEMAIDLMKAAAGLIMDEDGFLPEPSDPQRSIHPGNLFVSLVYADFDLDTYRAPASGQTGEYKASDRSFRQN